jgi:hypothetical protein
MSTKKSSSIHQHQLSTLIDSMMPSYYDPSEIIEVHHNLARRSWDLILNDTAPAFLLSKLEQSKEGDARATSAITLFFDLFYGRLFDVHPVSKMPELEPL